MLKKKFLEEENQSINAKQGINDDYIDSSYLLTKKNLPIKSETYK